jgi:Ni/Fe-hydrogenase 1 B-type cytochrome subunit
MTTHAKPLSLRIWHWLNMLAVLGLLGTVLLRKTLLSWRSNSALIESRLRESGSPISPELAKEIAVAIRAPLWDWHIYLGYMLAALLLFRLVVFVWHNFTLKLDKAQYHLLALVGYIAFYLATMFMIVTGFMLYFKSELPLNKEVLQAVKESHELVMWFFVVFAFLHIIVVVLAECRNDPGLVSRMVGGR